MKINFYLAVLIANTCLLLGSTSFGQSWNPTTGDFDGTGDFSATEDSDPWSGPQLFARNGGELTYVGDAEHNGRTRVEGASSVFVDGSFNHTNAFQGFAVTGNDGQGGLSSLTIVDVANSNVNYADFLLDSTELNLNSVISESSAFVRDGARLNVSVSYTHLTLPTICSV